MRPDLSNAVMGAGPEGRMYGKHQASLLTDSHCCT